MERSKSVRVHLAERIATLTIDRTKSRNALDRRTIQELISALTDLEKRPDVDALILTGAGRQSFVAGADILELRGFRRDDALAARSSDLCRQIEGFRKITIAAINGHAIGGGCELAMACDLRIAVHTATFGQPEVRLGVVPAAGATQRLPRIVGLGRAKYLILTGARIDAQTALHWGLVTNVVSAKALLPTARRLAESILKNSPLAIRLAKRLLNSSAHVDLEAALLTESLAQGICFESDEKAEGTAAFLEKRVPDFRKN
jgi:enoyl-CoA hydratase